MKQITAFKLSNGDIVEDYQEALKIQRKEDIKQSVKELIEIKSVDITSSHCDIIYKFITDNVDDVRKALSNYK